MRRFANPSVPLLALLYLLLIPRVTWSLLTPPIASLQWVCQERSCCRVDDVRSRRSWGPSLLVSATTSKSAEFGDCQGPCSYVRKPWGSSSQNSTAWVTEATPSSRPASYASSSAGLGKRFPGGSLTGRCKGGEDSGMPAAEGKDVDGEPGFNFFRRSSGLACVAGIMPSQGAAFAPFVWLSAMWGLYATSLRQSPMATKALTAGVLAVGGDIAAQCFEFKQSGRQGAFVKDSRRLLAVAIDSMLITGPALHKLYGILEYFIPTSGGGFFPAACHVLVDTFFFDPMFVISFFCVTGLLESRSLRGDILPALRREFWPAVRSSWIVSLIFCPLQLVTFRYLPLDFRVLSVNVCDIVWTSVLSYFSHKAVSVDKNAWKHPKGTRASGID